MQVEVAPDSLIADLRFIRQVTRLSEQLEPPITEPVLSRQVPRRPPLDIAILERLLADFVQIVVAVRHRYAQFNRTALVVGNQIDDSFRLLEERQVVVLAPRHSDIRVDE